MRLLLNLDGVNSPTFTERRQQITPDMRFTCDGMITKWIIGARWDSGDETLCPELQIWRNIGHIRRSVEHLWKLQWKMLIASMNNMMISHPPQSKQGTFWEHLSHKLQ